MPLIGAGDSTLSGLYGGNLLAQRRASLDPVLAARTQAADNAGNAIDQSIYGQIGQLDANAARRGFVGGSSFDRNRILMASIGAKLAAAQQRSGARLQNASDVNALNESDVNLRFQNLNQPFQRAASTLDLQYAPLAKESAAAGNAMNPVNFFRIGTGAFQYQNQPTVQPNINGGMVAGAGLGQIGSALGNYYGTQQLVNALGNGNGAGGGIRSTGAGDNPAINPATGMPW
jgi:hypothetical protein